MTGFPRNTSSRGGFRDRRITPEPQKIRAAWIAAPVDTRVLAVEALGEPEHTADYRRRLTQLSLTLRDLTADNFPLATPSARIMAAAFLALARNFAHPAWPPEARTACAPFLKAGAECIDSLLAGLRSEEAVAGRRVLGERDDER